MFNRDEILKSLMEAEFTLPNLNTGIVARSGDDIFVGDKVEIISAGTGKVLSDAIVLSSHVDYVTVQLPPSEVTSAVEVDIDLDSVNQVIVPVIDRFGESLSPGYDVGNLLTDRDGNKGIVIAEDGDDVLVSPGGKSGVVYRMELGMVADVKSRPDGFEVEAPEEESSYDLKTGIVDAKGREIDIGDLVLVRGGIELIIVARRSGMLSAFIPDSERYVDVGLHKVTDVVKAFKDRFGEEAIFPIKVGQVIETKSGEKGIVLAGDKYGLRKLIVSKGKDYKDALLVSVEDVVKYSDPPKPEPVLSTEEISLDTLKTDVINGHGDTISVGDEIDVIMVSKGAMIMARAIALADLGEDRDDTVHVLLLKSEEVDEDEIVVRYDDIGEVITPLRDRIGSEVAGGFKVGTIVTTKEGRKGIVIASALRFGGELLASDGTKDVIRVRPADVVGVDPKIVDSVEVGATEPEEPKVIASPFTDNISLVINIGDEIRHVGTPALLIVVGFTNVSLIVQRADSSVFELADTSDYEVVGEFKHRVGEDTFKSDKYDELLRLGDKVAFVTSGSGILIGTTSIGGMIVGNINGDSSDFKIEEPVNLYKVGEKLTVETTHIAGDGTPLNIGDHIIFGDAVFGASTSGYLIYAEKRKMLAITRGTSSFDRVLVGSVKEVIDSFFNRKGNTTSVSFGDREIHVGDIITYNQDGGVERGVVVLGNKIDKRTLYIGCVNNRIEQYKIIDKVDILNIEGSYGDELVELPSEELSSLLKVVPLAPGTDFQIGDQVTMTSASGDEEAVVTGEGMSDNTVAVGLIDDPAKMVNAPLTNVRLTKSFIDRVGDPCSDGVVDVDNTKLLVGDVLIHTTREDAGFVIVIWDQLFYLDDKKIVNFESNTRRWQLYEHGKKVVKPETIEEPIGVGDKVTVDDFDEPFEVTEVLDDGSFHVEGIDSSMEMKVEPSKVKKILPDFPGPPAKTRAEATTIYSAIRKLGDKSVADAILGTAQIYKVISDLTYIIDDITSLTVIDFAITIVIGVQAIKSSENISFITATPLYPSVQAHWTTGKLGSKLPIDLMNDYIKIMAAIITDNFETPDRIPEALEKFQKKTSGNLINLFKEFFIIDIGSIQRSLTQFYETIKFDEEINNAINYGKKVRKLPYIEPITMSPEKKESINALATAKVMLDAVKLTDLSPLDDLNYDIEKVASSSKVNVLLASEAKTIKKSVKEELGFSDIESRTLAEIISRKPEVTEADVADILARVAKVSGKVEGGEFVETHITNFKRIVSSLSKVIARLLSGDNPLKRVTT
jgi:hypothetical protein